MAGLDARGLQSKLLITSLKPGSQYVAQLRGAARCLRRFVNTQPRTNRAVPRRAARIDPSSKLAARCGAAEMQLDQSNSGIHQRDPVHGYT